MSWRSVRFRLTGLVVLVAAVAMLAAATLGVSRIRESLIDDVIADTATQALFIDGIVIGEGFVTDVSDAGDPDGSFFDEPFVDDFFVDEFLAGELPFLIEELEILASDLDRVGALDSLLREQGRGRADGLAVLHSFGLLVIVGIDGAQSEVPEVDPENFDSSVAFESNLHELISSVYEFRLDAFLDEDGSSGVLDEDFFEVLTSRQFEAAAEALEVEVATTEIEGVAFVVAADVSDVTRSIDKIRTVLWATMPVLVLLAAIATWFLTGRALSPVRRMSRQVGVISGGTLHERVVVPPTGDEIQELATTMNSMLDRLEADDQRLRQFVSDASHELRSPVAVLRSEAEVALRAAAEGEAGDLAQGVLGESLRLERIVADLLVLARGDEARGPGRVTAIDLDDIVLAEAVRRRRVPVDAQGVSAGRVLGTREGCERVLVHLLDNAARHADQRVAVALHGDDTTVTLTVDDDGPGIPAADRDRIFERFARLEAARTRDTGGAGLGLAVVAATVTAMAGEISVADGPLGGARFTVTWPVAS